MINNNPLISVIIPLYNAAKFIAETLDSVLVQTYVNWECIVVDDGSTDNSAYIVLGYCNKDKRITYHKQLNGGPSKARNIGLTLSKGDYIQYLDADDVLLPSRFEHLLLAYQHYNETILFSSLLVGKNDDIYATSQFGFNTSTKDAVGFNEMYRIFGKELLFIPGSVLFPRSCLLKVKWNESLSHSEDWDYYLQISKKTNFRFQNYPEVLFLYRNTSNSLSTDLEKIYKANYKILEKYRNKELLFAYAKKAGYIFYRNLINWRSGSIATLVNPISFLSSSTLTSILLLPFTLMYCVINFLSTKK